MRKKTLEFIGLLIVVGVSMCGPALAQAKLPPSGSQIRSPYISIGTYRSQLIKLDVSLANAQNAIRIHAVRPRPAPSVLARLYFGHVVALKESSQTVKIWNPSPFVQQFDSVESAPSLLQYSAGLAALRKQVSNLVSASYESAKDQVRLSETGTRFDSAMRKTLSTAAFAPDPIGPDSLFLRFWDALTKLFPKSSHVHASPPPLGTFAITKPIMVFVILLLCLVAVSIFRSLYASRSPSPEQCSQDEENLVQDRNARGLIAAARSSAASGEYQNAYRLVYLATLVRLDEDRRVDFNKSKTNWEQLRRIKGLGFTREAELLLPPTERFDHILYGSKPARRADYERIVVIYNQIETEFIGAQRDQVA